MGFQGINVLSPWTAGPMGVQQLEGDFVSGGKNAADYSGQVSQDTLNNVSGLQNLAKQYRKNVPAYEAAADAQMQEQASNQDFQNDQQLKSKAANRGLLYSGILQGAQNQARGNMASALMNKRAKVNSQIESNAYGLEQQAAGVGLSMADLQRQAANQKYEANYKTSQQNPGLLGGFMQGFGGG